MTTRIRTALLFLLSLVLVPATSPLQGQQQQGDKELQFSASFLSTVGQEGVSASFAMVQAKGGYFLTDRIEIGAFPSLVYASSRVEVLGQWQSVSDTKLGMGVFTSYSFLADDAMTVPYVGAQFYRMDLTDDDETGWIGANAGVKFYLNRSTAFDVGGNYLVGLGDMGGALILFQVGLSFLL
ncbi:MAG: hypothetical protein EA351_07890 [Gemmatimonadales bacterium]|nr:MAG: hypothetical protein EA351_07890 [Gemmatimonadales bacterium]